MVSEAHCMSFPRKELLLINYAKVKTVFHSMAPLRDSGQDHTDRCVILLPDLFPTGIS